LIRALIVASFIICVSGKAQTSTFQNAFSGINLTATSAQSGVLSLSGTNISSLASWSNGQLTTLVNVLNASPTISASDLPRGGMGITCWSLQNSSLPPLPGNTIGVDGWLLSDGSLLLSDLNYD
jgi:hypothetical protein